ncbi:MAG: hypothetical protein QXN37_03035 [Candidatus Anstonellaceae archaeon]
MKKLAQFIFICFALTSLTYAILQGRSIWVWGWESLVGIAVATVIFLLSIGYFAAAATGDEKLRVWVKKEVWQAAFSLIILIFALALVSVVDEWLMNLSYISDDTTGSWNTYVNTVCCPSGANCQIKSRRACHIELANDYLQTLYETARMTAFTSLKNYWNYAFLGNIAFSSTSILDERQGNLNISPFAGLSLVADIFSSIFDLSIKLMMLARVQQIVFDYLWYAFFPVMMSIGLVLRIPYFTRKLGGLLISLALSSYIVLPMFYVIANAILFGFMDSAGWAAGGRHFGFTYQDNPAQGGTPLPMSSGSVDFGTTAEAKEAFDPSNQVQIDLCQDSRSTQQKIEMIDTISGFIDTWKNYEGTKWYTGFFEFISSSVAPTSLFGPKGPIAILASLMIFNLIVPFLGLMTTLATIKYFSPLIGGDVEISVLSRLI